MPSHNTQRFLQIRTVLDSQAASFYDSSYSPNCGHTLPILNIKAAGFYVAEEGLVDLSHDRLPLLAFLNASSTFHMQENRLTPNGLDGLAFLNTKAACLCGTSILTTTVRENLAWLNVQSTLVMDEEEDARSRKQLEIIAVNNIHNALDYTTKEDWRNL
ncbi:hypothetical protein HDU89_001347 [Geranomyces variabilis]|nr:hypothetical protein HDU89_001347 [Geranomyces variabilis]